MSNRKRTDDAELRADLERVAYLRKLLTIQIVGLASVLRRSGELANRRRFGVTGVEWRIISEVGSNAPLSLGGLADLLMLDRGQLSRAVKGLVARDILVSRRRPGSQAIMISLGPEGDAIHQRMVELVTERNAFLVGDLEADEVEQVAAILAPIRERAQILLEREQALAKGD